MVEKINKLYKQYSFLREGCHFVCLFVLFGDYYLFLLAIPCLRLCVAVLWLAMCVWQATARSALEMQWFTAELITYTVCECHAPECLKTMLSADFTSEYWLLYYIITSKFCRSDSAVGLSLEFLCEGTKVNIPHLRYLLRRLTPNGRMSGMSEWFIQDNSHNGPSCCLPRDIGI